MSRPWFSAGVFCFLATSDIDEAYMTGKNTPDLNDDALAREVDKLLRKLPGADPYLKGDPEPAVVRPAGAAAAPSRTPLPRARPARPSRVQRIAVWVRVGLGMLLGA